MSGIDIWGIDDFSFDDMSNIDEGDLIDENLVTAPDDQDMESNVSTMADRIASNVAMFALNTGTLSAAKQVQFVSRQDDKVCDKCDGLDGNLYDVNPETGIIQDGPVIPDDTHDNCRCRYFSVDDTGNPMEEPTDDSYL